MRDMSKGHHFLAFISERGFYRVLHLRHLLVNTAPVGRSLKGINHNAFIPKRTAQIWEFKTPVRPNTTHNIGNFTRDTTVLF